MVESTLILSAILAAASTSAPSPEVEDLSADQDEWAELEKAELDSGQTSTAAAGPQTGFKLAYNLRGFAELLGAGRLSSAEGDRDFVSGESRGRIQLDLEAERAKAQLAVDFVGDALLDRLDLDLRNAWVDVSFASWLSVRAGSQVLTWGTGDFLFLNDLFPKDFQSFFVGRADEFLKAPSTSIKLSLAVEGLGFDVVWTPFFASDRFITGERLSVFIPIATEFDAPLSTRTPSQSFRNGEFAGRLYGRIGAWELAAYGYLGFFKQPLGVDPETTSLVFPRLGVYGGSLRGVLLGGVLSLEGAFYHSLDDTAGDDPFVPNSQVRGLVGWEVELLAKLTLGLQAYAELTLDHSTLLAESPIPQLEPEELRLLTTLRLTYLLLMDDLQLSVMGFVSPTDVDVYVRASITYRVGSEVDVVAGANIFAARDAHTFFGQIRDNSNAYLRLRYTY